MENRDPPYAGENRRPSLPPSTNLNSTSSSQTTRNYSTPQSRPSSEEPLTKVMATHKSFDSTKSSSRGSRDSLIAKAPTRKPSQEASSPPPPNPNDQAWDPILLRALSRHITDVSQLLTSLKSEFETLRSLITCKICYGLLYEPYTTSCGHTYCYTVSWTQSIWVYLLTSIVLVQVVQDTRSAIMSRMPHQTSRTSGACISSRAASDLSILHS